MEWLSIAGAIAFYTIYPVLLLGRLLLYILDWILSPFVYAGYVTKQVALVPYRFLAEFEVCSSLTFHVSSGTDQYQIRLFGTS
jgi:hypothetical protein